MFDAKHDSRHKARLLNDGRLTDDPLSRYYSGVTSLRGIGLVLLLTELNGLYYWGTDAGNTCLEALTTEKVNAVSGLKFGPLEGHNLIIIKVSYGLRTYGLRWHERLADYLR